MVFFKFSLKNYLIRDILLQKSCSGRKTVSTGVVVNNIIIVY